MTEYGVIINAQLIIHKDYHQGDKPIRRTAEPVQEGYYATYDWQDNGSEIEQVWEIHKSVDEPEQLDDTATEEDYLSALSDLGVK